MNDNNNTNSTNFNQKNNFYVPQNTSDKINRNSLRNHNNKFNSTPFSRDGVYAQEINSKDYQQNMYDFYYNNYNSFNNNPNNITFSDQQNQADNQVRVKFSNTNNHDYQNTNFQDLLSNHYNQYLNKINQEDKTNHEDKIEININSIIGLCTYVIPALAFLIIIFNYQSNKVDIQKHARQAIILQTLWLVVLYILNSTKMPLVAGNGITLATLWNIIYIIFSIRAGYSAYLGNFYKIPVLFDIASNFIEKKSNS